MPTLDLTQALLAEREAAYRRLRGGFPIPLAGATWWLALAALGTTLTPGYWIFVAFVSSGIIFPLALLYARLFGVPFMQDRTAVSSVILPAFVSMLCFWPLAVAAWWHHAPLVPLVLAVGMALHWPVIGWSYARTGLFSAHAVVRAVGGFALWQWMPAHRFTLLPLFVAVVYVATVALILADVRKARAAAPALA